MMYLLLFIVCFTIGWLFGLVLYSLATHIKKLFIKLKIKKDNIKFRKYIDYCIANNICPPGVMFTEWRLVNNVRK